MKKHNTVSIKNLKRNNLHILFLLSPYVSIFNKKSALEVSIGGSNAAGVIESFNNKVDMYDCNYILNSFRDSELLTLEEFKSVTDPQTIINIFNNTQQLPLRIEYWVKYICIDLPSNFSSYDAICVSLNRWMYEYFPSIASFAMTVYILKELNANINIFVGGEYAYEMLESHGSLNDFIKNINFFSYVRGRNVESLLQFIKNPKQVINLGPITSPQTNFKVNCNHNYVNNIISIFPLKVLKKYPNLEKTKKLTLSPFKFSEGCIFKCAFCPSGLNSNFSKSEISISVDRIETLVDKGYRDFKFFNDNINFKLKWTIDFANEIVKRNLTIRFSDSANLRVGSEEMFNALSAAGCIKLWFGAETIVPSILKTNHKEVTIDQINKMLTWSDNNEIWNCCNFIVNFPYETKADFNTLLSFIKTGLKSGLINAYHSSIFKVLIGTEYEQHPENFNIRLTGLDKVTKMYKFDEIHGLTWDERVIEGNKKDETLSSTLYNYRERLITTDDFLLFFCRKAGYNKKETLQIINTMIQDCSTDINSITQEIINSNYYKKLFTDI